MKYSFIIFLLLLMSSCYAEPLPNEIIAGHVAYSSTINPTTVYIYDISKSLTWNTATNEYNDFQIDLPSSGWSYSDSFKVKILDKSITFTIRQTDGAYILSDGTVTSTLQFDYTTSCPAVTCSSCQICEECEICQTCPLTDTCPECTECTLNVNDETKDSFSIWEIVLGIALGIGSVAGVQKYSSITFKADGIYHYHRGLTNTHKVLTKHNNELIRHPTDVLQIRSFKDLMNILNPIYIKNEEDKYVYISR